MGVRPAAAARVDRRHRLECAGGGCGAGGRGAAGARADLPGSAPTEAPALGGGALGLAPAEVASARPARPGRHWIGRTRSPTPISPIPSTRPGLYGPAPSDPGQTVFCHVGTGFSPGQRQSR